MILWATAEEGLAAIPKLIDIYIYVSTFSNQALKFETELGHKLSEDFSIKCFSFYSNVKWLFFGDPLITSNFGIDNSCFH